MELSQSNSDERPLLVPDSINSDQQPASPPNRQPGIIAEPKAIHNDTHSDAPQPVIEGSLNTQPSQQEPTAPAQPCQLATQGPTITVVAY